MSGSRPDTAENVPSIVKLPATPLEPLRPVSNQSKQHRLLKTHASTPVRLLTLPFAAELQIMKLDDRSSDLVIKTYTRFASTISSHLTELIRTSGSDECEVKPIMSIVDIIATRIQSMLREVADEEFLRVERQILNNPAWNYVSGVVAC